MKYFALILFVSVLGQFACAQDLRIVKDNINCTYGIKDGDGNWVVDASYILIEEYNTGYFRMRDEVGLGIFTPQGKELLPCIHDEIKISAHTWHIRYQYDVGQVGLGKGEQLYFYGFQGDKQHVYSVRGKKVASFTVNTDFRIDSDYSILAYDRIARYSQFVDSSGVVLIDSIRGKLASFSGRGYSLVGDNLSGSEEAIGNARVVNRMGELLLDFEMDRARIDSKKRVCFIQNERFGVISMDGDTIIAPKYKRWDGSLDLHFHDFWVISDDEGRAGVMNRDGAILIEPQYDKVISFKGINRAELAWLVEKDGRYGLLGLSGEVIIPMNYDQIYPIHYWLSNQRNLVTKYVGRDKDQYYYLDPEAKELSSMAYDSILPISEYNYSYSQSFTRGIITKRAGKYGVLNPDGTEVAKCVYDMRYVSYRTRYLMGQGESLTEYRFSRDKIEKTEWLPVASHGTINIYSNNLNYISVIKSKSDGKIVGLDSKLNGFQKYGDLLTSQYSDSREWVFFNLQTKKRLPLESIISARNNGRGQFIITTRGNRHGVIDLNANLIIDTIYTNINTNRNSSKIWATKAVGNGHACVLLDSIGRQVIPNHFDGSFEINSGDQIVSQNQKKGLIDSKTLRWKIRPNYLCLLKQFGDYYYVGNELNKKGIVKADGKIILPVAYDTVILLYTNCQLNGTCPTEDPTKIRWIVRKGKSEYLVDQNGKLINSKTSVRSLKASLFFDHDSVFSGYYQYRAFPVLDYSPSLHFLRGLTLEQIQNKREALWKSQILKKEVLDTINRIWDAYSSNCGQTYYWGITVVGDQQKPNLLAEKARRSCDCYQSNRYSYRGNNLIYQLRSIGSKYVTVDVSYQNQNYGWDHLRGQAPPPIPANQHINIIEEKSKARYISLKDIFPDDDILMQEFMESLGKRDDLNLECSSLENMLQMVNGSFSLSDEGIHLYLGQYNHYSNSPVELLIPIENLEKLTTSKWIVPYLKN